MINKDYKSRLKPIESEIPGKNLFFKGIIVALAVQFISVVIVVAFIGFLS